jgi:XTP/dITP diphosphohydrolase
LRILLATKNLGKVKEIQEAFKGEGVTLLSLTDFHDVPTCVEDGNSFRENAIKKACFYAKQTGLPCISDDSGLEVFALKGRPGVYSQRYAGENATDEENNQKLLEELTGIKDRRARFVCVMAIVIPKGDYLLYEGTVEGEITTSLLGDKGFGYDPIFFYPPLKKTFAQLDPEEKNLVSHRGKALELIKKDLPRILAWIRSGIIGPTASLFREV